ncbi:M4 family metallopeptidase [Actinoplanes sp. NEAU-A12]|uniref:M4 family metallopeptidase n=1 Tax=Actinoplanes sandaracinus TaxID=3045177 RepID=A0ABT6WT38_9ACTN|nr:M4 family metallopeptidase [Actinoplanes sandaracinus]MDI6099014.1 M4 family metallopeptidase [Actinoplanes sandaracinus]MDI6102909.1 M4 family metallopeptidase [Actinoplanes sandaracinus]
MPAAWTSIDTVAHEMAHGITSATADLIYAGESGSLNEAASDIFGALVEFHADNPADPPDYLQSEQRNGADKPLRFMDDPAKDGESLSCWTPALKSLDVHHGSGVGNKFFYTLAVGSGKSKWGDSPTCGGAPAVTGIGNDKAGKIWYRALTTYMVSYTNYSAAREATLKAAADLYGADSSERKAVDAAWKAVAVDGSDPVATGPQPTDPKPGTPPQRPAIEQLPPVYGVAGKPVTFTVKAYDPQDDPVTYSATGLPAGLTLDPATGRVTGVVAEPTTAVPEVTAKDPAGNSAMTKPSIYILPPLTVNSPGQRIGIVGSTEFVKLKSSHDEVKYTATGLPPGLTLRPGESFISGSPTTAGTSTVVVTATDPAGQRASVTFEWRVYAKVSDIPRPPRPSSGPSASSSPSAPPGSGSSPKPAAPSASRSSSGPAAGGPSTSPASSPATEPTAAADGPLALTGANVAGLAGIGALFVVVGVLLVTVRRRRSEAPRA